jgi:hypothetical protein
VGRKYLRLVPEIVGIAALSAYAVQPAACAAIEARSAATSSHSFPCCRDEHSVVCHTAGGGEVADEQRDRGARLHQDQRLFNGHRNGQRIVST